LRLARTARGLPSGRSARSDVELRGAAAEGLGVGEVHVGEPAGWSSEAKALATMCGVDSGGQN